MKGQKNSKVVRIVVGTRNRIEPHRVEVSFETDQDGSSYYLARSLELPGCMSDGPTSEEALLNLRDAIQLCSVKSERGGSKKVATAIPDLFLKGASVQVFPANPAGSPAAASGVFGSSSLYPLPSRRGALVANDG